MSFSWSRFAAVPAVRAKFNRRIASTLFSTSLLATCAHAVIVRGHVTDALGAPVEGARVQLIARGQVVAVIYADKDGAYEIRYAEGGRFTLLGSAAKFLPGIGQDFYGGATDVVEQQMVLATNTVRQEVSVTATGIPTPLPQVTAPVSVIPGDAFTTRFGVIDEMRQTPGAFLVQTGQAGGLTSLFMRGGNSTANLVLVDGIPAEDVGGTFDFGTVSSTAVSRIELYRGPNSALFGTDAGASVITIDTPRGLSAKPVLNYSGDAGNLHTWRNELSVGGTAKKLDYYAAFSRFDTSNAIASDRYHSATSAANIGYDFNGNTLLRFTIRNADSATGLPGAHDFYGISNTAKESDQDLYSGVTLENRTESSWHNLLRYSIARKREQEKQFGNVGTPIMLFPGFTEYFGNVVTIRGANGYKATGQASFVTGNDDEDSNRDQLYYQSDWSPSPHFFGLFGFRYDNERGSFNDNDVTAIAHEKTQRTNFEYNLQFQGEFFNRLFYSAGGAFEKNHLYGVAGTPRLGLAYVPVRSSSRWFHGTKLRANAAIGVQEPTLAIEYFSLYDQVLRQQPADIAAFHIAPPGAERSRTFDLGIDQNIKGDKLVLKAGYFHNVFDKQIEGVYGSNLSTYFNNVTVPTALDYDYFEVNSLAFRAQGAEAELTYMPTSHVLVRTGYTYLQARVLHSLGSDALAAAQGFATTNPNLPGIAIGAEGPLIGARPFRRAPNTGYFVGQYTRQKFSVALKGAFASRSDDSTFLDGYTPSFDDSLLLPNRDLDFGYLKLDLSGTYVVARYLSVFTQLDNLLNDQHIGPIGYPGLPLTVRVGLKVRIGGD